MDDPERSEKVTNIENDKGQSYDLKNLSSHNLPSDDNDIFMDVVGLFRVVFYDPVYVPFDIVFVIFHEPLNIKYLGTLKHSHHFHEVHMFFCSFHEFEILRRRDQRYEVKKKLVLKISRSNTI